MVRRQAGELGRGRRRQSSGPACRAQATAVAAALAGSAAACSGTLDAGKDHPHGLLPVDERNPIVIVNDHAYDNWFGEYAVLLASDGGPPLAGIIVNADEDWPDLDANVEGWRGLVEAARASGLSNVPDPIASIGAPLVRPASGAIDDTEANRSEGARFIIDASRRLSLPYRPLVVATGGGLTDVADAYLMDPTVADRVIVVASLGLLSDTGAQMGIPNGDKDPWAGVIVSERLRYVQVSAYYSQLGDVTDADVTELPDSPLGDWIAAKQPNVFEWEPASDQVAVVAVGLPGFVTGVARVTGSGPIEEGATEGPSLTIDPDGTDWLVTASAGEVATEALWRLLGEPRAAAR